MISSGISSYLNTAQPKQFKGYDDIVKVLDKANNTLISPKKICYIGGFALDLETGVSESNTKQVTTKAVEKGFTVSESVIENLATVSVSGHIANYSFNEAKKNLDISNEYIGDIGKRLTMTNGFFLNDLFPPQINAINQVVATSQKVLNAVSNKIEFSKSLNGINEIIAGGNSVSRSQKQIAFLKALFDSNALVEFACEFAYYPQMMITQLDISRDDVRTGSFIVNITLQEFVGVEIEIADLNSSQFATNLSRNDIQSLPSENIGEQKIAKSYVL